MTNRAKPAVRGAILVAALTAVAALPAAAGATELTQVRTVYRGVLNAEYFGPAAGVCSRLTATGLASFAAGGGGPCPKAFAAEQKVLRHKVPGLDDSGYTPTQWREVVDQLMAGLKVTLHGRAKASAIGPSGIPGLTHLAKVGGRWMFTSYPPSVQS
jgi:hypothetical protein